MTREQEWDALPEEEKRKRIQSFEKRVRLILQQVNPKTRRAVLKSVHNKTAEGE